DLKTAVGKGAVLALAVSQAGPNVRLEFDWELSKRLPFDVAYRHLRLAAPRMLFREHQLYEQLGQQTVPVLPPDERHRGEWVVLERRWPGGVPAAGARRGRDGYGPESGSRRCSGRSGRAGRARGPRAPPREGVAAGRAGPVRGAGVVRGPGR